MQNRLLAVTVLAQVIVEAVNEPGLAVGERGLPVKVGCNRNGKTFRADFTFSLGVYPLAV